MQSRSSLNAALSDRMSRSKMALLLPSPPTALQVMKADIKNGIIESKNLHIFVACVKQAAGRFSWLLPCDIFNLCRCHGARGWFYNGARGGNPPPPYRFTNSKTSLSTGSFTSPMGDAPMALYAWFAMDGLHYQPLRSVTGTNYPSLLGTDVASLNYDRSAG